MKLKRVMIAMLISILVLNVVLWDKVMAEKYQKLFAQLLAETK